MIARDCRTSSDRLKRIHSGEIPARTPRSCRWCACPGVIGAVTPLRPGMTLAGIAKTLERAFATKHAKAVALVINSPGGSPVQSRQIYLRIRQLAAEKKLPVLVFVEDVAASGGYMIACAGDEIFCDPSSILGSIGVVGGGFRFSGLDQENRRRAAALYGRRAQGDARSVPARKPDDVARLKALQREIHAIFIALVKGSRGARPQGQPTTSCSPANTGRARTRCRWALRTRSAISGRRCARAMARRC